MLAMFLGWKALKRTKVVKLREMDLETDTYPAERLDSALEATESAWKTRAYNTWRWVL